MSEFVQRINQDEPIVYIPERFSVEEQIADDLGSDFVKQLSAETSSQTNVVTIIRESAINVDATIARYRMMFEKQLTEEKQRLQSKVDEKINSLQRRINQATLGNHLLELTKAIGDIGWVLFLKKGGSFAYKQFNPAYPVIKDKLPDGTIREYDRPICYLASIQLNLESTKMHNGAVGVITVPGEGQHPNVWTPEDGEACVGDLETIEIDTTDIPGFVNLLKRIEEMYIYAHPDSAWHKDYLKTHEVINEDKAMLFDTEQVPDSEVVSTETLINQAEELPDL